MPQERDRVLKTSAGAVSGFIFPFHPMVSCMTFAPTLAFVGSGIAIG